MSLLVLNARFLCDVNAIFSQVGECDIVQFQFSSNNDAVLGHFVHVCILNQKGGVFRNFNGTSRQLMQSGIFNKTISECNKFCDMFDYGVVHLQVFKNHVKTGYVCIVKARRVHSVGKMEVSNGGTLEVHLRELVAQEVNVAVDGLYRRGALSSSSLMLSVKIFHILQYYLK